MPEDLSAFLSFAHTLADTSRALLSAAGGKFSVELKEDFSEVTNLDRQIEEEFRRLVASRYPDHGVIGEEFPRTNPEAELQWIFDPIDGTQNFSHHIPTFGTIIALHYRNEPIVGLIDHPALTLRYTAVKGGGCFCNGDRIVLEDLPPGRLPKHELLVLSPPSNFKSFGMGRYLDRFLSQHKNIRIYGDCFGQTTVLHGRASGALHANFKLWDIAALPLLIREAGGELVILESHSEGSAIETTQQTFICGKPRVVQYLQRILLEPPARS
jgi:fructose-1,6-bisphosphatase/inositol monophosphatase family enzyme